MKCGELWNIKLGKYSDKYLVTFDSTTRQYQLRRVRLPKTKIDAVRLPEYIDISFVGTPLTTKK